MNNFLGVSFVLSIIYPAEIRLDKFCLRLLCYHSVSKWTANFCIVRVEPNKFLCWSNSLRYSFMLCSVNWNPELLTTCLGPEVTSISYKAQVLIGIQDKYQCVIMDSVLGCVTMVTGLLPALPFPVFGRNSGCCWPWMCSNIISNLNVHDDYTNVWLYLIRS